MLLWGTSVTTGVDKLFRTDLDNLWPLLGANLVGPKAHNSPYLTRFRPAWCEDILDPEVREILYVVCAEHRKVFILIHNSNKAQIVSIILINS